MSHPISKPFICHDCVFVFSIHSKRKHSATPYCPSCGDNIAVTKYVKPVKQQKKFWTEEELTYIDKIISGELLIYQVAIKLGRTRPSIKRRVERRMEELRV
jgi:hypothetical protein